MYLCGNHIGLLAMHAEAGFTGKAKIPWLRSLHFDAVPCCATGQYHSIAERALKDDDLSACTRRPANRPVTSICICYALLGGVVARISCRMGKHDMTKGQRRRLSQLCTESLRLDDCPTTTTLDFTHRHPPVCLHLTDITSQGERNTPPTTTDTSANMALKRINKVRRRPPPPPLGNEPR